MTARRRSLRAGLYNSGVLSGFGAFALVRDVWPFAIRTAGDGVGARSLGGVGHID